MVSRSHKNAKQWIYGVFLLFYRLLKFGFRISRRQIYIHLNV
uniref:Uncharacterized protein n=1 Tax=Setaria italica TaxID=4555 RepID=K3XUF5_SETIT